MVPEEMSVVIRRVIGFLLVLGTVGVWACTPTLKKEASKPEEALVSVRFFPPTFQDDMDLASLRLAINRNLIYLNKISPDTVFQYGPHQFTAKQVLESQKYFLNIITENDDWGLIKKKIRDQFHVYRAAGRAGNRNVLFTGYFEPILKASLTPDETYRFPLYTVPDDLLKIELSLFSDQFKNERIVARIDGNRVVPYYTRHDIDIEKVLNGKGLEIAWLKDPIDVVFLQIQGSGRLELPDGGVLRVGYNSSNGRPYRSIGRYMIDKGFLSREEVSMQSIRRFLSDHPEEYDEILSCNPSYVFFRKLESEPLGNINVPLVPGRSLALDSALFPKGALAFISCVKPNVDQDGVITGWRKFSRFVLNQDTGGAIKGAGRADLFWGAGPYAEIAAGNMKHEGELFLLIKKDTK